MANRLDEIMQIANAGKQLNAPRSGVQKVVNADGTVTEIPYMEDRFGRRTVMTSQGPQVLPGHEGKDVYGDLGGKIGNVLGGLINKGRLGRQERIAEKSVAQQERTSFPRGPGSLVLPPVPENLAELNRARERLNYKTPEEKINYFDMSAVQSSVKPTALQEKLNFALPAGVSVRGGIYNSVDTRRATKEEIDAAFTKIQKQTASSGSPTTSFAPKYFKNLSRFVPDNAGNMRFYGPNGIEIKPDDPGYQQAIKDAAASGPLEAGAMAFATGQGKDRSARMTEISANIRSAESKQGIYVEMIEALDAGANTGYFRNKVPSMVEASVVLDNLQAQLGLDVIANTTFGALSESELAFALSAAAPLSLEPKALRSWLLRKQAAQRKLIDYLYEAGDYIGQGGTEFGFMAKKRRERGGTPDASSAGASTPDLSFLPVGEREEAAQALENGEVTIEQLRASQ